MRIRPLFEFLRRPRALSALVAVALLAVPTLAPAAERRDRAPAPRLDRLDRSFDFRSGRASPGRSNRAAQARLRRRLGRRGVLRIEPLTGTPRLAASFAGGLTPPRRAPARAIALDYLSDQREAFRLDGDDLRGLEVQREYRSAGISHVQMRQVHRGIPAFDNTVQANVTGGRLLTIGGAPQPDLSVPSIAPGLGPEEALGAALREARAGRSVKRVRTRPGPRRQTTFAGGHRAGLVLFGRPGGSRLAWALLVFADAQHVYRSVVDAFTGRVLKRENLVHHAAATGSAFDLYPGATAGGTQQSRTFDVDAGRDRLRGNNAWTYSDARDVIYRGLDAAREPTPLPTAADEVPPSAGPGTAGATWAYGQVTDTTAFQNRSCPLAGCTWSGYEATAQFTPPLANWQRNRRQNGTQVHYFVNHFHDHLKSGPISFDEPSGNFEEVDTAVAGEGSDPVHAQVDDGAETGAPGDPGFPDGNHVNNASMLTLPDGFSPIMSTQLFSNAYGGDVHDVNGGDDAQVVYHEYVHGLSNRLVCCDSDGFGQLDGMQAGAMGEAWSDWYTFDFLNSEGLQPDTAASGELRQGQYESAPFVTQPTDCPPGGGGGACPGTGTAGPGGYTYGDFSRIVDITGDGRPDAEVHADGEIWAQTLWDLRSELIEDHPADGILRARKLVTGGMRLSPPDPDFLDMRDAIISSASSSNSGQDMALVRRVFAARGMGACASSDGSGDVSPTPDFRASAPSGGCNPPPVTPPTPPVVRLADIGFSGFPRRASLRRVLRRGLAGSISCNVGCSFSASLVLPRRSARRAGLRGRTVVVSRVRSSDVAGGSGRRIRFKFKSSTARKLRRLTRGTALALRVSAADSRGTRRTEKKKLILKR